MIPKKIIFLLCGIFFLALTLLAYTEMSGTPEIFQSAISYAKTVWRAKKNISVAISLPPPSPVSLSQKTPPSQQKEISPQKENRGAILSSLITAKLLKECLAKSSHDITPCLDGLFHPYIRDHSTKDALALVQKFSDEDAGLRVSCHPVVHSVGRETFLQQKTIHNSFAVCDQTCHSGCYHGAIERFLRGGGAEDAGERHISEEEIKTKAARACDTNDATRFRFQCLHGLGHALMFFLDYKLEKTLASCDIQPDGWSRSSCYGGVFMENVFSATPEKRDLSPTDYHYPCSALNEKYKSDCYMMQTTRMSEMGLDINGLFRECRMAGAYKLICFQSMGRDLSNDVRIKDPAITSEKCERGADRDEINACTRGVIYALIDNTWTGKYAFPFCASFRDKDAGSYCFAASTGYLKATYQKSNEEIAKECGTYLNETSQCTAPLSAL